MPMNRATTELLDDGEALKVRFRQQMRARIAVLAVSTLGVLVGLGAMGEYLSTPHPLSAYKRASAGIFDSPLTPTGPLKRVHLGVRGLVCVCGEELVTRLQTVPGLCRVRLHFATRDALVDFDPQVLPLNGLLQAFTTAGFPALVWSEPQGLRTEPQPAPSAAEAAQANPSRIRAVAR